MERYIHHNACINYMILCGFVFVVSFPQILVPVGLLQLPLKPHLARVMT